MAVPSCIVGSQVTAVCHPQLRFSIQGWVSGTAVSPLFPNSWQQIVNTFQQINTLANFLTEVVGNQLFLKSAAEIPTTSAILVKPLVRIANHLQPHRAFGPAHSVCEPQ